MTAPHLRLPGVTCAVCGSADLVVILVGTDGDDSSDLFAVERPVPDQGWCSVEHAWLAGWPWIVGERQLGEVRG